LQLAPRARDRQPLDEQQVLDPQHALDVGAPVDARPAVRLRDTEIRELRLPRSQHVRLHLRDVADFQLAEQRPMRDLGNVRQRLSRKYIKQIARRSPRTATRTSHAGEPRERSAAAKRRARERVGESEGQSPSDKTRIPAWLTATTRHGWPSLLRFRRKAEAARMDVQPAAPDERAPAAEAVTRRPAGRRRRLTSITAASRPGPSSISATASSDAWARAGWARCTAPTICAWGSPSH